MPYRPVSISASSAPAAVGPSRSSTSAPSAPAPEPTSPLPLPSSAGPKPRIPKLTLDSSRVPCLVHPSTFNSRFLPFADPVLYGQPTNTVEEKQPGWSWWLESYYRMYAPAFWVLAVREYRDGLEFVRRYERWKVAVEGGEAGRVDACEMTRMKFAAEDVEKATKRLFRNVHCLHHVRDLFLAHHRRLCPDKPDQQLLEETLQHEKRPYCTVAAPSVWPLPSPPPPDVPSPSHTPSVSKLTHLPNHPFLRRRTSARSVLPADVDPSTSRCRLRLSRRTATPPPPPPPTQTPTTTEKGSHLVRRWSRDLAGWTASRREALQRRKSREGHVRLAEEEEERERKELTREGGWYAGEGAWAVYWF